MIGVAQVKKRLQPGASGTMEDSPCLVLHRLRRRSHTTVDNLLIRPNKNSASFEVVCIENSPRDADNTRRETFPIFLCRVLDNNGLKCYVNK